MTDVYYEGYRPLRGKLSDSTGPIDLSDAVDVRWWRRVNGGELEAIEVELDHNTSEFVLPKIDTSTPGTTYEFEAEIVWGDNKIETVPNTGPLRVVVGRPEVEDDEGEELVGIADRLEAREMLTDQALLVSGAQLLNPAQLLAPTLWLLRELAKRDADVVAILELLAKNLVDGEVDSEELTRLLTEKL